MKGFMNRYMKQNRSLELQSAEDLKTAFEPTITVIHNSVGGQAFKPVRGIRSAVFDAVMVGVARRLEQGPIEDLEGLQERYEELLQDEDFQQATQESTSDEERVRIRIALAEEAFVDVS
jgi:hypothetical protein